MFNNDFFKLNIRKFYVRHKATKPETTAIKWRNFCFLTHEKRERIADPQSISLAALPCKLRFAAKHMLFLPPRAD